MSIRLTTRIKDLGLVLPPAPKPVGVYRPTLIVENQLYLSGQGPVQEDGSLIQGKVGATLDKDQAKDPPVK